MDILERRSIFAQSVLENSNLGLKMERKLVMEHVVQIAFDFDDQRVKDIVEKGCVDQINKELKQHVIDGLFKQEWGSSWNKHGDPNRGFQDWVEDAVKDVLNENRDTICKLAAHELAQSISKSSKWKEKIVEEVKKA
jgi:hypothetical protein